ncbi:MAG: hypothetical protein GTN73_00050 [Candidatus Aminicenantes bacterium]|nr:hypothetical protein [Candidatus Aminicenantes bacterium]
MESPKFAMPSSFLIGRPEILGDLTLQPSQPLPGILYLSNTRVSVFPEVEEFLVMLYGYALRIYLIFPLLI